MTSFDKSVWRQKAWNRFQRLVREETTRPPARGAETQWARDVIYIEKLSSIVGWCEARALSVSFAKRPNGVYDPSGKEIVISARASPEKQAHFLLHECGHHLIGMKEHHERFGMGYPQTDPQKKKTIHHRISCLEEELEAWHRGWKLSKRLKIGIDRTEFDRTRIDCIKTYIKWASRTKESEKGTAEVIH